MVWELTDDHHYRSVFHKSQSIFHSADFNSLNSSNAEQVFYLIARSGGDSHGIVIGKRGNTLFSPFSSPFGGIECTGKIDNGDVKEIIESLIFFCQSLNVDRLQITLPPTLYYDYGNFIPSSVYIDANCKELFTDQSYHLDLTANELFEEGLKRNARKNLNTGLASEHQFKHCISSAEKETAYLIIEQNRKERGYPLKLSFQQLQNTGRVVPISYFTLIIEDNPAAAAVVYEVTPEIAMVVYWGHLRSAEPYRPTNLLSFYLYEYFKSKGFKVLDIGPSSERGILNEGLANFKLSLGCNVSEKSTVYYEF